MYVMEHRDRLSLLFTPLKFRTCNCRAHFKNETFELSKQACYVKFRTCKLFYFFGSIVMLSDLQAVEILSFS